MYLRLFYYTYSFFSIESPFFIIIIIYRYRNKICIEKKNSKNTGTRRHVTYSNVFQTSGRVGENCRFTVRDCRCAHNRSARARHRVQLQLFLSQRDWPRRHAIAKLQSRHQLSLSSRYFRSVCPSGGNCQTARFPCPLVLFNVHVVHFTRCVQIRSRDAMTRTRRTTRVDKSPSNRVRSMVFARTVEDLESSHNMDKILSDRRSRFRETASSRRKRNVIIEHGRKTLDSFFANERKIMFFRTLRTGTTKIRFTFTITKRLNSLKFPCALRFYPCVRTDPNRFMYSDRVY